MASQKPGFDLTIPTRNQQDADSHRPSVSSPRSPRFHEDFDAPFSEAIMNASRTTLATDFSDSYPSSNSRHSHDADDKPRGPAAASTVAKARLRSLSLHRLRQGTLPPTEPTKASGVNDRIRDWARKSLLFTRKAVERPDAPSSRRRPRQCKVPSAGPAFIAHRGDPNSAPSPD